MQDHDIANIHIPADSRIHILQVVLTLEPGGMENGVVNIANNLDPELFRTSICCLEQPGRFADRLNPNVRVFSLNKQPGFHVSTGYALARLLSQQAPDVLHTHNLGPLIYASLAKVLRPWSANRAILHGEHAELHGGDLTPKRLRMRKLLFRLCTATHSVSLTLTEQLQNLNLPCNDMHSIINGVDTTRYSPPVDKAAAKERIGIDPDRVVVGNIARFAPFKRHAMLLDAFALVGATIPNAQLLLVGDGGPEQHKIMKMVACHRYKERILCAGFQQNPAPYYAAMDTHVLPSLREGLPNVVLESMACGVPNLIHPACGASEVIDNDSNGLIRRMDNAQQLATAINGLLSSPTQISKLGSQARHTAQTRFSLTAMIDQYSALYQQCVPQRFP